MPAGLAGRPCLVESALTVGKRSAQSGLLPRWPESCGLQALDLFRRRTGSKQFFEVDLRKEVPHGDRSPPLPLCPLRKPPFMHCLQICRIVMETLFSWIL